MKIIILVWIEELELQPLPGPSATIFDSLDQKSWLRHIASKDYKARFYDPVIKRFLNTDPIGYGDSMNMYAYVGGDPMNGRDPSGLAGKACEDEKPGTCTEEPKKRWPSVSIPPWFFGGGSISTGGYCTFGGCTGTGVFGGGRGRRSSDEDWGHNYNVKVQLAHQVQT